MATDWQGLWTELNERQRLFLKLLYERERAREQTYRSREYSRSPLRKGGEWRWVDHQGDLCDRLYHDHQLTDPGEGSTWKALDDRGYVERRWRDERVLLGWVTILSVRLTRRGRQLVREVLRREPPEPAPANLPEWAHLPPSQEWPDNWRADLDRIAAPVARAACVRLLHHKPDLVKEGFLHSLRTQLIEWLDQPTAERRYRSPLSPRQMENLIGIWQAQARVRVDKADAQEQEPPDADWVDVPLPGGGHARVAPDCPEETLAALRALAEAAQRR